MKKCLVLLSTSLILAASAVSGADFSFRADAHNSAATGAASEDALPFLYFDVDKKPGFVVGLKGGYRWNFFRNIGLNLYDGGTRVYSKSTNKVEDGGAASVSLGYNFGGSFPMTIGVIFGVGPSNKIATTGSYNGNTVESRQKVGLYTLDFSLDYDFCNRSRWTPFVGLTGGLVFLSNRAHAEMFDIAGNRTARGDMGKNHQVNFAGGFRTGIKYKINSRMTVSLYGSYSYLGKIKSHGYALGDLRARTRKARVHEVDAKIGLKIHF